MLQLSQPKLFRLQLFPDAFHFRVKTGESFFQCFPAAPHQFFNKYDILGILRNFFIALLNFLHGNIA